MSFDATNATLGELALDAVRAGGEAADAVPWFRLLRRCEEAGQIVRQPGGRAWFAYLETTLDDLVRIRAGVDRDVLVDDVTVSGGPILFVFMAVGLDEQWPFNALKRREKRSRCILSAWEDARTGRLMMRRL